MIRRRTHLPPRHGERGVTMVLVVLAMLSMLGIVALAIDVITLYSAKSEAQRAADAGALVAAKMLVDAGVTADPGNAALQTTAQTIATTAAKDVAKQSVIAGRPITGPDVTVTFPNSGAASFGINPQVSVTVQNANLPTFFSRIWSRAALTVRATALAEGFNPSNSSTVAPGGVNIPVIPRCVKPFIVPNCDPIHAGGWVRRYGNNLLRPRNRRDHESRNRGRYRGTIRSGFQLRGGTRLRATAWTERGSRSRWANPALLPGTAFNNGQCVSGIVRRWDGLRAQYRVLQSDSDLLRYHGDLHPRFIRWSWIRPCSRKVPADPAQNGVECLIHQRPGNGMDSLTTPVSYPLQIEVGNNHPLAGTVLSANDLVTTSDSLVTVPVYDGASASGSRHPRKHHRVPAGLHRSVISRRRPQGGRVSGDRSQRLRMW